MKREADLMCGLTVVLCHMHNGTILLKIRIKLTQIKIFLISLLKVWIRRGWFYTLHAIATLVFDKVAYKNVVSNGLVLDKNGQKMSKRLGNADPFETLEYGPDATRWYMISNANPWII
jgi:valyl-tRNA synthetase